MLVWETAEQTISDKADLEFEFGYRQRPPAHTLNSALAGYLECPRQDSNLRPTL